MKAINNKDIDDDQKDDNSQYHNINESFINKTKEEETLMEWLTLINFPRKVINYVIGTIHSCGEGMI